MSDNLTVIDLFAGLGGFSSAFEDSERWNVVRVDIEEGFNPDIRADILNLRPCDLPNPDLILASPPCKCFSLAASWADHFNSSGEPQTPEARESVALLHHTIGLIKSLTPKYWFLENPMGSKARQYLGTPTGRVTYCQYGTNYQKPTFLWGDHPPMSYLSCSAGDPCHESNTVSNGQACKPMPRDPAERALVPRELSASIREAVEKAFDSPQPEQVELISEGGLE